MSGNKGHFQPGNAAHKRRGKAKARGIAGDVRKHRKVIVAGLVEIATSGSASARVRALEQLARIGWGSPASAEQMGTVERVDGGEQPGTGIAAWHDRRIGTQEGAEDVMAMLKRMAGPERTVLEQVHHTLDGRLVTPDIAVLVRQRHADQKLEPPYLDVYGRIVGVIPGCLALPATAPATDVVAAPVEPPPHVGPPLVAVEPDAAAGPCGEAVEPDRGLSLMGLARLQAFGE